MGINCALQSSEKLALDRRLIDIDPIGMKALVFEPITHPAKALMSQVALAGLVSAEVNGDHGFQNPR